jgi:hypothetical protein
MQSLSDEAILIPWGAAAKLTGLARAREDSNFKPSDP